MSRLNLFGTRNKHHKIKSTIKAFLALFIYRRCICCLQHFNFHVLLQREWRCGFSPLEDVVILSAMLYFMIRVWQMYEAWQLECEQLPRTKLTSNLWALMQFLAVLATLARNPLQSFCMYAEITYVAMACNIATQTYWWRGTNTAQISKLCQRRHYHWFERCNSIYRFILWNASTQVSCLNHFCHSTILSKP